MDIDITRKRIVDLAVDQLETGKASKELFDEVRSIKLAKDHYDLFHPSSKVTNLAPGYEIKLYTDSCGHAAEMSIEKPAQWNLLPEFPYVQRRSALETRVNLSDSSGYLSLRQLTALECQGRYEQAEKEQAENTRRVLMLLLLNTR